MFHNVLLTNLAPIRDTNEVHCWDNSPLNTIWPDTKQEKPKDTVARKTIKKKKRNRTMFTTDQVRALEKVFARSKYIDVERRREISEWLQIEQKCIKIWFQNRRMKEKKELSESCDSSSESPVSSVQSSSPPLKSPQPSNESDVDYKHPHSYVTPSHSYPFATHYNPSNYLKSDTQINEQICYDPSSNPTIPGYLNYTHNHFNPVFKNYTDYSSQYYPSQSDLQYYYNTGDVFNNQPTTTEVRDSPANIFDTSYF